MHFHNIKYAKFMCNSYKNIVVFLFKDDFSWKTSRFLFCGPPRLLGTVGTSAARNRCVFSCHIHFSRFWRRLSKLSIDFKPLKTCRDTPRPTYWPGSRAPPKSEMSDHDGFWINHGCRLALMVAMMSPMVSKCLQIPETDRYLAETPSKLRKMNAALKNISITCRRNPHSSY